MIDFKERTDRLARFVGKNILSDDFPMLKGVAFEASLFQELQEATSHYLNACERAAGAPSWLELPNKTPNGLVVPKKEVWLEFMVLHQSAVRIIERLDIGNAIGQVHVPISVRLIDGRKDVDTESRRYATTKVHTDIWNGEPANALSVFFPILGDISGNGTEFFEPDPCKMSEWIKVLPDYQDGWPLFSHSYRYDFCWKKSNAYFVDPFLLHRTQKSGKGFRVSVDFRVIPSETVPSDRVAIPEDETHWRRNFVPFDEWRNFGRNLLLMPKESMAETILKVKAGAFPAVTDYSKAFEKIMISGGQK